MDIKYKRLYEELEWIKDVTRSNKLIWEKVPGLYRTYRTVTDKPRLMVSCSQHGRCKFTFDYREHIVPCEILEDLCCDIEHQLRQENDSIDDLKDSLRLLKRLLT